MLSRYTYSIWSFFVGVFATLMVLATWFSAISVGFFIVALIFFNFSWLALLGIGMYRKHPVHWKPNGEPELDE